MMITSEAPCRTPVPGSRTPFPATISAKLVGSRMQFWRARKVQAPLIMTLRQVMHWLRIPSIASVQGSGAPFPKGVLSWG
ncbi:hypothetical protein M8J76_016872 [Diaphorina citri]|nr:hypothetical protein M8J76_016872 [Diaphorina citri]